MKKLILFILLISVLGVTESFAAKIYKWVGDDGSVHYSSLPPDKRAQELEVKSQSSNSAGASSVDRNANRQNFLDGLAKEREDEAKKAQEDAEAAKEKEIADANCATARKNLASLKLGGRQYEMTPEGERHYLEEAEIQTRVQQNQEYIDQWCGES